METIGLILQGLAFFAGTMFIIGIIRPGFAVWWSSHNTRANVAKVWGVLTVVFAMAFFIMSFSRDDERKQNNAADAMNPDQSYQEPTE